MDVQTQRINGMSQLEYSRLQYRARAQYDALTGGSKQYQIGGQGTIDYGSGWLAGAFDFSPKDPYKVALDDLVDSSIVMLCIQWIQRTAPEAPLVVAEKKPDRTMGEIVEGHPLTTLLEYPNEYYSGEGLWQSTYLSLNLAGNAYWLKVRKGGGFGPPVELWYEPHFSIRPVSGGARPGDPLIKGYQLYREGRWQDIPREDVVHFRALGQDPHNPMLGINPLATALREVFTDIEAAIFTATLLKRLGVTNMVISPQKGEVLTLKEVQELVQLLVSKMTGERRGEPVAFTTPLDVAYPKMADTEALSSEAVRAIPQERIPALLGLNRLAVGIGQDGTYSNVGEAREAAVENNLLPTFRVLSKQLDTQLLPDFTGQPAKSAKLGCFFVTSAMRVLSEDADALSDRVLKQLAGGAISVNEARLAIGQEELPGNEGRVFYVPTNITVMESPAGNLGEPAPTAPASASPTANAVPPPAEGMPMMPGMEDTVPMPMPVGAGARAGGNGNGNGNGNGTGMNGAH